MGVVPSTLHGQEGALFVEESASNRKAIDKLSDAEAKALLARYRNARDKLKKQPDPLYDLIMDAQLARNEYPKEKLDAARASHHTCLAAKFCTEEVWNKYKVFL